MVCFGDGRELVITKDEWPELRQAIDKALGLGVPEHLEHFGAPWTPELDSELIKRYRDGDTTPQIAKALGRSKYAISRRIADLGIADRKPAAAARLRKQRVA